MPRISAISREQASAPVAATFDAVKGKIGMVPNLFATLANAPVVLNAYLALSETLSGGRLTAAQREVVALAIGQANQCQYCLSAHVMIGKSVGLSDAAIAAARRGTAEDAQTAAIAALAVKIVAQRGVVSDADLAAARAAGVDDGLVVEIVAHVALNTLTNYTNHIAATQVDFPVVAL